MVRIQARENQDELEGQTKYLGNTPMHMAAQSGHYLVVKYLIERQARSQITNNEDDTPNDLLYKAMRAHKKKLEKIKKK